MAQFVESLFENFIGYLYRRCESPSPTTDTDKFDKLAQLKALLDNGTLTQPEFAREKAKTLAEP